MRFGAHGVEAASMTTSNASGVFVSTALWVRACAWLACAAVIGMIAIFFTTHVGQDPLQFVHSADEYRRILLSNPPALRACIALDDAFIVFYTATFVGLGVVLVRSGSTRGLVRLVVGLMLGVAVLDMVENFHFLVMLARAELGMGPSDTEIAAQVFESLLKFHISYLGLFLLGLALPRRDARERTLARLSWFVQLPVGILIYVTPSAVAVPLVFVRFAYFLVALVLIGLTFGAAGSDAPASRPGTTPSGAG
jgi:hypothetical protein